MSASPNAAPDYVRNQLLRQLRSGDLELLLPRLEKVTLDLKQVIQQAGATIDHIYFVESGTVSMISSLADGSQAEVGLAGREGLVGLPLLLGSPVATLDALVQVSGTARRMAAEPFRRALTEVPFLRDTLLRYVNVFHLQVAQTAVCNSWHPIDQRLARWILMTADRAENEQFPMTQDFMSRMLGVQRPGVNIAARRLSRAGLISQERGWLTLLDRPRLESAACECYSLVRNQFDALFASHAET